MSQIKTPNNLRDLPTILLQNILVLSASGFGVVVALAWNEFIKSLVTNYIDPFLGKNGSSISLFIYALAVTLMAVIVTMQLSRMQKRLEKIKQKKENLSERL